MKVIDMSEEYVSLAEVRDLLNAEKEKREELITIQEAAKTHAEDVCKIQKEQADEMIAELKKLSFVTDTTSYKIADILPKYPEDVRAIFSKERINLEASDIQNVLDIVNKYQ